MIFALLVGAAFVAHQVVGLGVRALLKRPAALETAMWILLPFALVFFAIMLDDAAHTDKTFVIFEFK